MDISDIAENKNKFLLYYDNYSCIRNAYYHNYCQECVNICPENVFFISQNSIKVKYDSCTNCGACLGGCPTEALSLKIFDPNKTVIKETLKTEEKTELHCKNNSLCLASYDTEHYVFLASEKQENISCDLSLCDTCELNQKSQNRVFKAIETRIDRANRILSEELKSSFTVEKNFTKKVDKNKKSDSKRVIFSKALNSISQKTENIESEKIEAKLYKKNSNKYFPKKRELLIEQFAKFQESKDLNISNIVSQDIDFDKCTNCGDCVQFCPTDALFKSSDLLSIYFNNSKCISCGICNTICKTEAIKSTKTVNSDDIIISRAKKLVSFEMKICEECKTPFIDRKDNKTVCDRCDSFLQDHAHIFTLARDL
jgi:ferredoxin